VLLNANVAFLAIPSVDPGEHVRTPAQLASYLSIIASVGSVVTGLLLLRQHRTKPQDSAEEVVSSSDLSHPYLTHCADAFSVIGQVSPKSPSQCPWVRNSCDLIQSAVFVTALGVSCDKPVIVTGSFDLTPLTHSTIAFLSAFGLEALLFSSELWARLPVGVVLAMIIMLICWCVWTTLEANTSFSLLSKVHVLKDRLVNFTRGVRGQTSEPEPGAGDAGGGNGQGRVRILSQSATLKEALDRLRPSRRQRASMTATLVNPTGANGRASGVTVVEMDKIKDESRSPV